MADVAPDLKRRFNDWIDMRTARGMEVYGRPLQTDDGRNNPLDMMEELLDFCKYQHKEIMKLREQLDGLGRI